MLLFLKEIGMNLSIYKILHNYAPNFTRERKENKTLGCIMSQGHNNHLISTKPGMQYNVFWIAHEQMYIHLYKYWGSMWGGFAEHLCLVWNDKAQDVHNCAPSDCHNARHSSRICPFYSSKHKCPWEGITSGVLSLRKDRRVIAGMSEEDKNTVKELKSFHRHIFFYFYIFPRICLTDYWHISQAGHLSGKNKQQYCHIPYKKKQPIKQKVLFFVLNHCSSK